MSEGQKMEREMFASSSLAYESTLFLNLKIVIELTSLTSLGSNEEEKGPLLGFTSS